MEVAGNEHDKIRVLIFDTVHYSAEELRTTIHTLTGGVEEVVVKFSEEAQRLIKQVSDELNKTITHTRLNPNSCHYHRL